ncbi:MAG: MBL fold metallo-hydrolase [Proteobacteria bacterium]|nr:MBL fold metallo-hydrolase [Pseudomonadota bacterium]
MPIANYDSHVAVTRDIFWVGFYDEEAHLHCNPYLIIDGDESVLIDPGSIPHFPIVARKIIDLINPKQISAIVLSHQDPDVCGNLAVIEDVIGRPDLKIVAHSNSVRLIRHYGLASQFYAVDDHNFQFKLQSGRTLEFIFTPFLHSPGAIVTYDTKTKSLFSADIFGAASKDWHLFASGDYTSPMAAFHQLYMPSNRILKNCMDKFEKLDINMILPQHGSVLEGNQVGEAINFLKTLPCGIDLIEGNE